MILFLEPYFEVKPWAGDELNKIYECPTSSGEAWIVSGYNNKSSIIKNGIYKGQTLRWLWANHPELFGDYNENEFPLLIKLISAKEDLSIQVHPNDDYALKTKNSLGKFECWYILPETKAKDVTVGVNCNNAIELKRIIDNNQIEEFLIKKEINPGDLVVIEPGRVHAIHGDTFVLEIQESSDITYRLYDFNRKPLRPLHIEDSLNVIRYDNDKNFIYNFSGNDRFKNEHFNFEHVFLNKKRKFRKQGFRIIYILKGEAKINKIKVKKGDTFLITDDEGELYFDGDAEIALITPKKKRKDRLKMRKRALITGLVGQDGYYLTKLLLEKDYEVHGLIRSQLSLNLSALIEFKDNENFFTHIGDMTDTSSINKILLSVKPDEVYHLASQSHVAYSFEIPEFTAQVNALGTLRIVDAIKNSEFRTKLFNLSTQYLFKGDITPQTEETPFEPQNPYSISKEYAHNIVKSYRENYNIFAVNGIAYNHESILRDDSFVSKKIINAAKKIKEGKQEFLELGNLNASREWGFASDYAYAMWLSLQQPKATDYIFATGVAYTVREFATKTFAHLGINLTWEGEGLNEVAKDENGIVRIKVNTKFFRPNDAHSLLGCSKKFEEATGFKFNGNIDELINSMLED